jgi:hypothetical protein
MSAFGLGNNEEYLVHLIAVKHLLEQKETVQDVGKAFQAVLELRKQLEPLSKAPEGKTKAKKNEQRKKLFEIKEDLKATAETLKVYKLFRCFVVGKVGVQWDKIVQEMHCKDPWIGMNGQSHKGLHVLSWLSFQDCIELHKFTIFPADDSEKQRFYMQQTVKKHQ